MKVIIDMLRKIEEFCGKINRKRTVLGNITENELIKSSPYYKYGRIKSNGEFDWKFYSLNKK